ncbi:MAG: methyltransferase [Deltaproteobacteria bacterium]
MRPRTPQKKQNSRSFPARPTQNEKSFAALLLGLMPREQKRSGASQQSSPLVPLDYSEELELKDKALQQFWGNHRLPGKPEKTVASPLPRYYRTTSKRKAVLHRDKLYLLLDEQKKKLPDRPFQPSPLEPERHGALYQFLQERLSTPPFRLVASHLNYLIVRGSYSEQTVIFNVDQMNGPIVRKLKQLGAMLQNLPKPPTSAFIYLDPSRSDYYLESSRPDAALCFKKLYGPDLLKVEHKEIRYFFHPTSFSQINESMVDTMLELSRELLAPAAGGQLFDLYCGYGLFSIYLADVFSQITAVDAEGPSIRAAIANSRRNKRTKVRYRYLAHHITHPFLEELLGNPPPGQAVLLDPPRQGPHAGVISAICGSRPRTVLHIFCGVDQIPVSLKEWKEGGYTVGRVVPLDMFAGSANLEVLVQLRPRQTKSY